MTDHPPFPALVRRQYREKRRVIGVETVVEVPGNHYISSPVSVEVVDEPERQRVEPARQFRGNLDVIELDLE
jgi:hypothetical protein